MAEGLATRAGRQFHHLKALLVTNNAEWCAHAAQFVQCQHSICHSASTVGVKKSEFPHNPALSPSTVTNYLTRI